MSKVANCPANVVIEDRDGNDYRCKGRYYGDGRILCVHDGRKLMADPSDYHQDDPKRLYNCANDKWTKYRIKSVLLDSSSIRKNC